MDVIGTDSTGAVTVTVAASHRLADLHVSARWRDKVKPDRFAAALLEALANAECAETQEAGVTASSESPCVFMEVFTTLPPETLPAASRRASELLDTLMDDALERLDCTLEASTARYTGSDERGNVEVTLLPPGRPVELRIDERWIATVSLDKLASTVQHAFTLAYEKVDAAFNALSGRTSIAGGCSEILRDPISLRRWLEEEIRPHDQ